MTNTTEPDDGSAKDEWQGYFEDFKVLTIIGLTIGLIFYIYLNRYEIKHYFSTPRIISVYSESDPGTKKRVLVPSDFGRFLEEVKEKLAMKGKIRFFDMDGCELEHTQEMNDGDVLCVREEDMQAPSMSMAAEIMDAEKVDMELNFEEDDDLNDALEADIEETEKRSIFIIVFKVVRGWVLMFNWLVVLFCLFTAKSILIMLTQALNDKTTTQVVDENAARHALAIIILVPLILSFLMGSFKTIFYEQQRQSLEWSHFAYLTLEGGAEALGACIMVYRVLPEVQDAYRAHYVMCSVFLFPALAQVLNRLFFNDAKITGKVKGGLALGGLAGQVYMTVHMIADDNFHGTVGDCRYIVSGLILVSFGWSLNTFRKINALELLPPEVITEVASRGSFAASFAHARRSSNGMSGTDPAHVAPASSVANVMNVQGAGHGGTFAGSVAAFLPDVDMNYHHGKFMRWLESWHAHLTIEKRHLAQAWKAAVQISVTLVVLKYWFFHDRALFNSSAWSNDDFHGTTYWHWAGYQVAAACGAFYFGWLACCIRIQVPGYYFPLLVSTPLCILGTHFVCEESELLVCDTGDFAGYLVLGGVAWLSQAMFSFYTMYEPTEALAQEAHMWFRPVMYSAACLEQSLLANRRSRPQEDKLLLEWKKQSSSLTPHSIKEKEEERERDRAMSMEDWEQEHVTEQTMMGRQLLADVESGKMDNIGAMRVQFDAPNDEEKDPEARSTDIEPLLAHSAKATILIATTMWHEEEREMEMLLRSLKRVDHDLGPTPDDFESHVVFDNCIDTAEKVDGDGIREEKTLNVHVDRFLFILRMVFSREFADKMRVSIKRTPYGGRMCAMMPSGQMRMYVHLKDAKIIKIRKRMSQILYMNYFNFIQDTEIKRENTFLMTTDGDTSFTARSVQFMVDELKRDRSLGGVCGAIKPKGSGPMVWYQSFEYAAGHWFQKVAEDVMGTVLCCPGCFSMFRLTAINKVVEKYAENSITAMDYLQMDMGEDRWMCTLLIRKGYRFAFCANAMGETYAPEDFGVFFEQRRRWVPSTMANIFQLINVGWRVTKKYDNINVVFLFYTLAMFISSVLGPGTVVLLVASGVQNSFSVDPIYSLCLSLVMPMSLVFLIVWQCSSYYRGSKADMKNQQIHMSLWFSVIYIFLVAGVCIALASSVQSWSANTIFLMTLVGMYIIAGLLHPADSGVLVYGLVYLFSIPAMYLLLMIYSSANMHVMSWGTRDAQEKPIFRQAPTVIPANYDNNKYTYKENEFWKDVIMIYKGKVPEQKHSIMSAQLEDMRTRMSMIFLLFNSLWIMIVTTLSQGDHSNLTIINQNAVGLLFLCFFSFVLVMQFLCLLRHRYCMLLLNMSMPTMYQWEHSGTNNFVSYVHT